MSSTPFHKNDVDPTLFRCSSPDVGVVGALVHQLRVLLVEAQDAGPPRAAAAHAGRIRIQHHALVLMVQLPMGELHIRNRSCRLQLFIIKT